MKTIPMKSTKVCPRRSAAAKKAAATKKAKYGEDYFAKLGQKGGKAVYEKYGFVHMTTIGYAGAIVTCERYHDGDMGLMMSRLRALKGSQSIWSDEAERWVAASPEEAAAFRDAEILRTIAFAERKSLAV